MENIKNIEKQNSIKEFTFIEIIEKLLLKDEFKHIDKSFLIKRLN